MLDKAESLSEEQEFSADAQIDHNVLHECTQMCSFQVDQKKNALKALFQDGAEQIEY